MDRIDEMLDRLGDLSEEELTELQGQIASEFETVESQELSQQVVERMTQLADAAEAVKAEVANREAQAQELSRMRDEAVARVRGTPEAGMDEEVPGDEETPAEDETEDPATEASVAEPAESVAATETAPEAEAAVEETAEEAVIAAAPEAEAAVETEPEAEAAVEVPAEAEASSVEEAPEAPEAAEAAEAVADGSELSTESEETAEVDAPAETEASSQENTEAELSAEEESEAAVTAAANEPELPIEAPADHAPLAKATATVAITAGADIPGVTAGTELTDMRAAADAMVQRMHAMRRTSGGDGEQHTVATLVASFPEDRTLRFNEPEANANKIQEVVSPQAITAAGGFCAPVEVRYEVYGLGETNRPVKDSLAVFSADRGGIRYVTPPTLTDLDGAASLWTVQDDLDAAEVGGPDPTKPCIRVACGDEVVVQVDAIPLCLTFGNLQSRAYPEMVERNNQLGLIEHARFSETRLLTRIGTLSTAVTASQVLGAARDWVVTLDRASAGYRNRHRMDPNAPLRAIAPAWLRDLIRADIAMEMPGNGDQQLALAEAALNSWLSARSINVTWSLDGESGQIFGAQSAGALLAFPSDVVWYLFSEGTFLFLDGGTLDLGLVRDSTLNGTNDYKMFLETFEGVAKVGIESLRVTQALSANGTAAALTDTTP